MAIPLIVPLASAGISIAGSVFGASKAAKAEREAKAEERKSRVEMNRLKSVYSNLDTSNPYLNMENTMEDLTINQGEANFQAQQFSQSQSNILNSMRGAAGGSGIASLAQAMAQQGQLAAQRSSASIGSQEAANQRAMATQAANIQNLERSGEVASRSLKRDQVGTMLGMSQAELAGSRDQAAIAQKAKFDAISGGISNLTSLGASVYGAPSGTFSDSLFNNQ